MPLTPEQAKLSHEELRKDVHLQTAHKLLQEIDPNIELQWVKGHKEGVSVKQVGARRIIQMEG